MAIRYFERSELVEHPLPAGAVDLTGQQFFKLTIWGFAGAYNQKKMWWCKCECGRFIRVYESNLHKKQRKSERKEACGFPNCAEHPVVETPKNDDFQPIPGVSGALLRQFVHPSTKSEQRVFRDLRKRCEREGVPCPYVAFSQFYNAVGQRPARFHLQLIDKSAGLVAGNFRWAPKRVGEREVGQPIRLDDLHQLCEQRGADYGVAYARLKMGWCLDCAVDIPIRGGTCNHRIVPNVAAAAAAAG
jgi:hypothetical protein